MSHDTSPLPSPRRAPTSSPPNRPTTLDLPLLVAEALQLVTAGAPAWIVAEHAVVWTNDEGRAELEQEHARNEIVGATTSTAALDVVRLSTGRLVRRRECPLARRVAVATVRWSLTRAQARVLPPVVRGLSNKEIGALLGVEEATVEAHVGALFRKSGAANRSTLLYVFWTTTDR